jgi:hypothetical protein
MKNESHYIYLIGNRSVFKSKNRLRTAYLEGMLGNGGGNENAKIIKFFMPVIHDMNPVLADKIALSIGRGNALEAAWLNKEIWVGSDAVDVLLKVPNMMSSTGAVEFIQELDDDEA